MKRQEYVSQFGIDVSQSSNSATDLCIGCERYAPNLNENGYCYECSQKLQQQSNVTYKSALIKTNDIKKPYFSIIKIFNKSFFLVFAIFLSVFNVFRFAVGWINFASFLELLIIEWIIALLLSIPYFNHISAFYKNIKMLKNMKLYSLAQKEAPTKFITIDGLKINFAITENFLYIKSSNLAIPVKFIETLEIEHSRKYGFFLIAVMYSGRRFTIVNSGKLNRNQVMNDYISAILLKNPAIKLNNPYQKIL